MGQSEVLTTIVVICFIDLIVLPICIYLLRLYVINSKSTMLRNRQPHLTLFTCIAYTFVICVQAPASWVPLLFNNTTTQYTLNMIQQCIYPFSGHAGPYGLAARMLVSKYTFAIAIAEQNSSWKHLIDPQLPQDPIMKYRNNFRSDRWIFKRTLILSFISASIVSLSYLIAMSLHSHQLLSVAHFLDFSLYLIPTITIFVIWKKTPVFYDNIFLRDELRTVIITCVLIYSIYIFAIVIQAIFQPSLLIQRIMTTSLTVISGMCMLYIQIYWVIHKTKQSNEDKMQQKEKLADTRIELVDVLKDEIGFETFINYLSGLFCAEILLSVVEFVQYKKLLKSDAEFMKHIDASNEQIQNPFESIYMFSESVPISGILRKDYSEQKRNKYLIIIEMLYDKYIATDSDLSINISFAVKGFIEHWIKNHKHCTELKSEMYFEIYCMFDNCCIEMADLLMTTFWGFKNKSGYKKLVMSPISSRSSSSSPGISKIELN
eukprot:74851_1